MAINENAKYGQGATIAFYLQGDENVDFDANDFKIEFVNKKSSQKILLNKIDLTFVEANKYRGEISNKITKKLYLGLYTMEILLGESKTSIVKKDGFEIYETSIKSEVV